MGLAIILGFTGLSYLANKVLNKWYICYLKYSQLKIYYIIKWYKILIYIKTFYFILNI